MKKIIIHEVGIRDGLQAEKEVVPTEQKINWIKELAETGVDIIQAGSFVNPKKMPQMADTDELFKYFSLPENKLHNVTLSGLVLNEKGLERGMVCGVELFCMGVSASETHSQKNTGTAPPGRRRNCCTGLAACRLRTSWWRRGRRSEGTHTPSRGWNLNRSW